MRLLDTKEVKEVTKYHIHLELTNTELTVLREMLLAVQTYTPAQEKVASEFTLILNRCRA